MKTIIMLAIFTLGMAAKAGPSTSGGGFAVVCRDSNSNTILSAELLDIYEARTVHGFEIMKESGDEVRDYIRSVKNGYRLQGYHPPISDEEIAHNLKKFYDIAEFLPMDEKLPNLDDLGSTVKAPEGCAIEPVAIFYDSENVVTIDKQIMDAMNSLSRAALITHEIQYHYFRSLDVDPDTNSLEARLTTATSFALNLNPAKLGIPTNLKSITQFHHCEVNGNSTSCTQSTDYFLRPVGFDENGRQLSRLQFTSLAGRPLLTMTTVDIPDLVNYGDIYQIQSKQLLGWTAQVAQDKTRFGGFAVKLVIRRGLTVMAEVSL